MSTETLSSAVSAGIVLTAGGNDISPFTIEASGQIYVSSGHAISSTLANAAITNYGIVDEPGLAGVYLTKGGTVVNHNQLETNVVSDKNTALILNSGTIAGLVYSYGGGYFKNTSSNAVVSDTVHFRHGTGTVVNYGSIADDPGFGSAVPITASVFFYYGGTFINKLAGSYLDDANYGLVFGNTGKNTSSGSVINYGTIGYGDSYGKPGIAFTKNALQSSDVVENLGSAALISGGHTGVGAHAQAIYLGLLNNGTIVNQGRILSGFTGIGAYGQLSVQNSGLISGADWAIRATGNSGSITNTGTIIAASGTGIALATGSIGNNAAAAAIYGGQNGIAGATLAIVNDGSILGGSGYGVTLSGAGSTVVNAGTIGGGAGSVYFSGTGGGNRVVAEPGAQFSGNIVADGNFNVLELGAGTGTLGTLGLDIAGFETVTFDNGAAWTLSGTPGGLIAANIAGFAAGDMLVVDGFSATTASFAAGKGLVLGNGSSTLDIGLSGSFTTSEFTLAAAAGDTEITICFLPGTRILTEHGERKVEDLRRGERVLTRYRGLQPIKWIGRQNYAKRALSRERMPVRIAAGALGEQIPAAPLAVSPGHSMLLGETLVLAKHLVNGITITQDEAPDPLEYYAVELAEHDCVLANYSWSESFADGPGLRSRFHNLPEFLKLFPDYAEPAALQLCAPRPQSGPALEAALLPVLARAAARPGKLHGYIDILTEAKVEGWAWDEDNPELPVTLAVRAGNTILGTALACYYREDLAKAGLGRGRCMFTFALAGQQSGEITVRRESDGAPLQPTMACAQAA